MADIEEMKNDLKEIKKMLVGNGVMGVAEMARRAFEYCQWHKSTKNGLWDWTYRLVIGIAIAFIWAKVEGK